MTSNPQETTFEVRFKQGVGYLTEWTKHIITIASAILVLSVTVLKDIVHQASPALTTGILISLAIGLVLLLASVWCALVLVRTCASVVFSRAVEIGSGEDLDRLQSRLKLTQRLFFAGLVVFAVLVLLALASWKSG